MVGGSESLLRKESIEAGCSEAQLLRENEGSPSWMLLLVVVVAGPAGLEMGYGDAGLEIPGIGPGKGGVGTGVVVRGSTLRYFLSWISFYKRYGTFQRFEVGCRAEEGMTISEI